MTSIPLPFSPAWFIGAGVAFIVGLIAFAVASRLLAEHDRRDRTEQPRNARCGR